MKTSELSPTQRQEVQERRRQDGGRRISRRLSALLWIDEGRTREEVADLLDVTSRRVGDWLRLFRNKGLGEPCTLHYRGDPGRLRPAQVEQLRQEIARGGFHNAGQVRAWVEEQFGITHSSAGVRGLLHRIGASYHKASGFFGNAGRKKQRQFVRKYRRHRREAGPKTRRYFVDACHPVRGLELLYRCWLLAGQRHSVGVGSGRRRSNILGAYSPDDHDYVGLRLTKEDVTGERFVTLLEKLPAEHPETERFIPYLDNARYYSEPVVKEWLARHRQFRPASLPAYSPNLNLVERLWRSLRKKALTRWHQTFEAMQEAVAEVLDHLGRYRCELDSLMGEEFHILKDEGLPLEPAA